VVKKQAPLKLGSKTKTITIKKKPSKTYPKTPLNASLEAVRRSADHLEGMGFTRVHALETIAAQLHENLLALKDFHAKKGGVK